MLRIAAAVDGDGGAGVRGALQAALQELAPFDGGELVYARIPGEHASYLLGDAHEAFLGSDLVEHVLAEGVPLRFDDLRDATAFPDTLARLRGLGLRSILVLPFHFSEAQGPRLRGALAIARRHGWAFVGASLHDLAPLAGLAGLAFDQALRLSALSDRTPAVFAPRPAASPPAAAPGGEALTAELEAARQEASRAAEALREALQAGSTLRDRLAAAEAARLEAERSRHDWARQAGSLAARNEKQTAEIRELTRGLLGAREAAAAATDVAQAREVRIRELEAELRRASRERPEEANVADGAARSGSTSSPLAPGPGRGRSRRNRPAG
jgi:hypothetical protein